MGGAKAMRRNVRRIGIVGGSLTLACGVLAAAAVQTPVFRFPLTEAFRLTYDGEIRGVPVTSGASIFLPMYSGVRPTIRPAMKTAISLRWA